MADEKTVEVELLLDHMRDADGVEHVRGDVVKLPESRAKELEELGAVGQKGTIKKRDQEAADAEEREARQQRILSGLERVEGRNESRPDSGAASRTVSRPVSK